MKEINEELNNKLNNINSETEIDISILANIIKI